MLIKIKTISDRTIQLDVEQQDTIDIVKSKIQNETFIAVDQQQLIYSGKVLDNERTLSDYQIKKDAILHLVIRLRGGSI